MTALGGKYDAIVIGAGGNGLTLAAILAKRGKRVAVVEQSGDVGGFGRTIEFSPGFRSPLTVDGGWVPPEVTRALGVALPAQVAPTYSVSVRTDDGLLSIPCDPAAASGVIARRSPKDAAKWPAFVSRLRTISGFLEALYTVPAPSISTSSISDIPSLLSLGRRFRGLGKQDMMELLRVMPMSVQDFLDDEFEDAALKAAVGAGGVYELLQGPRSGGTTFNLLHHLVGAPPGSVRARTWWRDGPDAWIRVLLEQCRGLGVSIAPGARVKSIDVDRYAVQGVTLEDGRSIEAPRVLSTARPMETFNTLLDPKWVEAETWLATSHIKARGSTAVIMYALDELPPGIDHNAFAGVVSLSPTLDHIERAYDVANYKDLAEAPHIELTIPSLRWRSLAPEGKHVMVARVQYWPDGFAHTGDHAALLGHMVAQMIDAVVPGFDHRLGGHRAYTPPFIEMEHGVSPTHADMTLDQILFMRPMPGYSRYAMPIDGLYLAGSGAHPGSGVVGGPALLAAAALRSI